MRRTREAEQLDTYYNNMLLMGYADEKLTLDNLVLKKRNGLWGVVGYTPDFNTDLINNNGILKIPKYVEWIGDGAFIQLKDLKKLIIPTTVYALGKCAFQYCDELTDVTFLGKRPRKIPAELFRDCVRLTNINLDYVTSIDNLAFSNCKLKNVTFTDNLKKIGNYAFENNPLLKVVLPNNLDELGTGAFNACWNLKKIVFNQTLKKIPVKTCNDCTQLISVLLPQHLEVIGASAFYGCSALEQLYLPNTLKRIEACAFKGCLSLKAILLPDNLNRIDYVSFADCAALQKISIGTILKTLEPRAFEGTNIKEVHIRANSASKETIKGLRKLLLNGGALKKGTKVLGD